MKETDPKLHIVLPLVAVQSMVNSPEEVPVRVFPGYPW